MVLPYMVVTEGKEGNYYSVCRTEQRDVCVPDVFDNLEIARDTAESLNEAHKVRMAPESRIVTFPDGSKCIYNASSGFCVPLLRGGVNTTINEK